jgi:acylaminoacyl-peptidase
MSMSKRIRVFLVCSLTLAVWAGARDALAQRAMTLVDILNVPRVSDPQLSPDGRQILYVLSTPDWKANKRVTHIWRVPAAGG